MKSLRFRHTKAASLDNAYHAITYMSCVMRFPTMWYVRPAKAQTSLRIRIV